MILGTRANTVEDCRLPVGCFVHLQGGVILLVDHPATLADSRDVFHRLRIQSVPLTDLEKKSGKDWGQKKRTTNMAKYLKRDFGLVLLFQSFESQVGRETMPASSDFPTTRRSDSIPEPEQPTTETFVSAEGIGRTDGLYAEGSPSAAQPLQILWPETRK